MSSLYVATYVDIQRGRIAEGIALIVVYREASSLEPENQEVDVFREIGRSNRFVVIESWPDESIFVSHEEAPQTLQFRTRLKEIHSNPYDQRVHNGFAVGTKAMPTPADSLCVVTHVDVPPTRKDECEVLLRRLAEQSRSDTGNIRYDVFQQTTRTNHFTIFAAWNNAEAFEAHELKPHRQEFRERLWPILGAPYDERLYKPLRGSAKFGFTEKS